MKTVLAALACAAAAATISAAVAPATAQAQMQTQAAPLVAGAASVPMLRTGTPIALRMSEPLTTKEKAVRVGQRFRLETAEPVMVAGRVVVPTGSSATGEVTEVRNKGMWGKSGRIAARLLYVMVDGRQIRLTGLIDDKGTTGTAGVVGAIAFVPVAGFFTTGTSATIPLGAPVNGFIDEDVPVAFAGPAQGAVPLAARSR